MTVRTAAAIVSLSAALISAGCLSFSEISVETPIQAKIDITAFQRVLVAGFLSGGSDNIDPNTETARLIRSQLRGKQDLRVIDSDAIPLVEEIDRRAGADAPAAASSPILTQEDLEIYERIFDDTEYWKALGARHEQPLIVTGSVLFTEVARSGEVPRPQSYTDPQGIERYRTVREFVDQKGYALTPKFVFIDGRTGEQLYSESYHEETLYPATQSTPALSSYFEMMDKLLPSFLNTLSNQKIRGTRVLLK
jgi:hypothetical protein